VVTISLVTATVIVVATNHFVFVTTEIVTTILVCRSYISKRFVEATKLYSPCTMQWLCLRDAVDIWLGGERLKSKGSE